jgi:acetamidase/formamidase
MYRSTPHNHAGDCAHLHDLAKLVPLRPPHTFWSRDVFDRDFIDRIIEQRKLRADDFATRWNVRSTMIPGIGDGNLLAPGSGGGGPVFDPAQTGTTHVLQSTKDTVQVGAMDPALPAVLTIDSGDVVQYPNTWLMWGNEPEFGMSFEAREAIRRKYPQGPYSMPGPVAIRGAVPGDVVECRMLKLRPLGWGWNSAPRGVGALPNEYPDPYLQYFRFDDARTTAELKTSVRIPLKPVQGVMSVQPPGEKPVSAILTGAWGGNVVLSDLTAGTSLFLPVQVPEAMGFADTTLDDAITAALRNTITWISAATDLSPQDVYALCSIVGSFRVTQYAHQVGTVYTSVPAKTVHSMLPKSVFHPDAARAISAHFRNCG